MSNTLVKFVLDPGLLIFLILLLAWLFAWTPWRRIVRRLIFCCLLMLGVIYFGPLPALLSQPLATRFPPTDFDRIPEPDLIVVLGGMTAADPIFEPGSLHPPFVRRSERFLMGVQLATRFPDATLIFTGWSGPDRDPGAAEASRLARLAASLGVPVDQILIEPLAQTTADHPVRLSRLPEIGVNPDQTTYILTSAVHMPRAMGVFAAAGWQDIHAVPVDYPFPVDASWFTRRAPAGRKLTITYEAVVEWVGLIAYRSQGKITSVFAGPDL